MSPQQAECQSSQQVNCVRVVFRFNLYIRRDKHYIIQRLQTYSSPALFSSTQQVLIILHQRSCSNNSNLSIHKLKANVYNSRRFLRKRFGQSATTPRRTVTELATGSIIFPQIHTLLQPVTANIVHLFFLAQQPPMGQGLLIHEVSKSYTTTHHRR